MSYHPSWSLRAVLLQAVLALAAGPALAVTYQFSTGLPDGKVGTASGPTGLLPGTTESADDFLLGRAVSLQRASIWGLVPFGEKVISVALAIYRVFPNDSADPPDGNVPSRAGSPSDLPIVSRDASSGLSFVQTALGGLQLMNSILPGGIHPLPNTLTGGNGPVVGEQIQLDIDLGSPLELAADHYFLSPQVTLSDGTFLWLSAPRPIVAPGSPFSPDLQSWIRDDHLAPDWARVGTDVIGSLPSNAAFSLSGETVANVPAPAAGWLLLAGLGGLLRLGRRRR